MESYFIAFSCFIGVCNLALLASLFWIIGQWREYEIEKTKKKSVLN